jgi:hypothetical protein
MVTQSPNPLLPLLPLLLLLLLSAVIHGAATHPRQQHLLQAPTPTSPAPHQPQNSATAAHAPLGRHTLLEFYKIPGHIFAPLTDTDALQRTLTVLIQQAGMTYLGHSCHVFAGTHGVTCVFLLSESHLSIHTWPEHQYAGM